MTEEQQKKLAYMLKRQAKRLQQISQSEAKPEPRKRRKTKSKSTGRSTAGERNARSRQYYDLDRAALQHMRDL
ncbi:hypothetical protein H6E47_004388 [Salmonella enterica]|nr:hypothetical protein [Salmonella enterica]EGB3775914.1 hypothetical protein [Salmonella enterica]EHT9123595.1 hypothetical protein [Salmonella enterica]